MKKTTSKKNRSIVTPQMVLDARKEHHRIAENLSLAGLKNKFMTVIDGPTGTGKTLVAKRFGYRAKKHLGRAKMVVASPYIQLCRQTEDVWKLTEGSNNIVRTTCDVQFPNKHQKKKAKEFEHPITIISVASLLKTLLRPDRKDAVALGDAIVILDDVDQAIPIHAFQFFVERCKEFHARHGTHFILTSATFPRIWKDEEVNYIRLSEATQERLKHRSVVMFDPIITNTTDLATSAINSTEKPVLIVMNTKEAARRVIASIIAQKNALPLNHDGKDVKTFFITTDVAPAHRRLQEEGAERAIRAQENVIVVGTSCIRTGWDVSGWTIYAENAGFIATWQMAGRGNRDGQYLTQCIVHVIEISQPGIRGLSSARLPAEVYRNWNASVSGELTPTNFIVALMRAHPLSRHRKRMIEEIWLKAEETGVGKKKALKECEKLLHTSYYRKYVMSPLKLWDKKDRDAMVEGKWSVKILRKYRIEVRKGDMAKLILSGEEAGVSDPENLEYHEQLSEEGIPFLHDSEYSTESGLNKKDKGDTDETIDDEDESGAV